MFEVGEEASEKIKQFLEGREGLQTIRVLMTEGDWRGPPQAAEDLLTYWVVPNL
jgi:hypothetical protein